MKTKKTDLMTFEPIDELFDTRIQENFLIYIKPQNYFYQQGAHAALY